MQKSLGVLIFIVFFQHGSCILVCKVINIHKKFLLLKLLIPLQTKMACRTSGKGTCTDPFCFVTPVNEKVNAANFGCGNVTRPMYKVNVRTPYILNL